MKGSHDWYPRDLRGAASGSALAAAEAESQAAHQPLERIFGSTRAMIYMRQGAPAFPFVFVSGSMARELGYQAHELAQEPSFWISRIHPEDLPRVRVDFRDIFRRGHLVCEYRFLCKHGTYRWLRDEAALIRHAGGAAPQIAGHLTDITKFKQKDDELAGSAGHLASAQCVADAWGMEMADHSGIEQRLRSTERQLLAMLEERERLSRDLHDSVIQTIYAAGFSLEECQRLIAGSCPPAAVAMLSRAIASLNGAIRDVRRFIGGYEVEEMSGERLRDELNDLAKTMAAAQVLRLRVSIHRDAAERLPPPAAYHLLCIAREAISNSLRHSRARIAFVKLRSSAQGVRFEARDNGIGFDTLQVAPRGLGLRNIAARAQLIGARLDVVSERSAGTRIVLDLPSEVIHGNSERRGAAAADRR